MNRMTFLPALGLCAALALGGCYRLALKTDGLPSDRVYFTPVQGRQVVRAVHEVQTARWLFWGTTAIGMPDAAAALAPYLETGQRVQNLAIRTEAGVVDQVLTALTLGIYSQRSVIYTGEVVD